jgi:polysaccharide deacetylase 2 family uncharacterized protein YibQ
LTPSAPGTAKNTTTSGRSPIESALGRKLAELEVRPADIASRYSPQDHAIFMQAAIPKGKPLEWIVWQLSTAVEGTAYRVSDCTVDERKPACTIVFSSASKRDPQVTLVIAASDRFFSGTAQMAFVVENLEDTAYQVAVSVLSFTEPVTVSLAPAGRKAFLIAQLAEQYKKEVIVRLPLEPAGKIPKEFEQSTIMVHYSPEAIRRMISDAVKHIPNVKGFSNLWGSRALEDTRVMTIVLEEAKKLHGYFAEAKYAKNSVAGTVASRIGLPYQEISARLEKTAAPDLLAEIKRYAAAAQAKGSLVVRCWGTRQTADALRAALPFLRQNGIQLAFVSDILK